VAQPANDCGFLGEKMSLRRITTLGLIVLGLVAGGLVWTAAAQENSTSPIQVGVIVQDSTGQLETFCITLEGENPTGADAILASGLDITTSHGFMGETICRIGHDGCTPPGENCFCQCEGGDSCAYWNYFHLGDQGNWQYSAAGAGAYVVTQGDVEGWWWRSNANPGAELPVLSFDMICGDSGHFPRTVTDGLGREITLDAPPERIASVTLGSDEILLDLVEPERLAGVTFFADNPAISNVAGRLDGIEHTDLSGNPEQLISLNADLVIMASYSDPATVDQLLDAGVPVFVLTEFNTIGEIRANIRLLGQVTGEEARAEKLINDMDSQIAAVQTLIADQEPVRVLYYEPGGVTYGPGSTVDQIITMAGGVNVIADAAMGAYPLINAEFVLATDPDVILLGTWFTEMADPLSWFTDDPVFSTLQAVQHGRVYAIHDAHITNVSHYMALGVDDVARILYPNVFDEVTD
jgi:iron complex transport system substrate-binding protein